MKLNLVRLLATVLAGVICLVPACHKEQDESKPEADVAKNVNGGQKRKPPDPDDAVDDALEETEEDERPKLRKRKTADFYAGSAVDAYLVRLFADAFFDLSRRERVLTYHLARAVLAGRDIAFDQLHDANLEVRHLMECIHKDYMDADPNLDGAITRYLERMWLNDGFYDSVTRRKFTPTFSFEELARAAKAAYAAGVGLGLQKGESLEAKLSRLRKIIFDPHRDPVLADPRSRRGKDILKASNLNLYKGVTMREAADFTESHAHNARLVKIEDRLVEEVYRAGDKLRKIPRGRYSQELRRLIRRLQDGMISARRKQRRILTELVDYFKTGKLDAFERACRRLISESFAVEFFAGFVNRNLDPRHLKGIYDGFVGCLDEPNTLRVQSLVREFGYFENAMPWDEEYREHRDSEPVVAAIQLITAARRSGLEFSCGQRLTCSFDSHSRKAEKVLFFSNMVEARQKALYSRIAREFVPQDKREVVISEMHDFSFTHAAIQLILGYDIGVTDRWARRKLKAAYAPLEALRAELVALWLLADPKLDELGLLNGKKSRRAAFSFFATQLVVEQSFMNDEEIRNPDALARRILARYLVEKAKVVDFEDIEGKIYPVITGPGEFRKAVADFLRQVEKILATSERQLALRILKKFSAPAQWSCLEGWSERAREAGLFAGHSFVLPKLKPQFSPSGKVVDVFISHEESFDRQMMRYRPY